MSDLVEVARRKFADEFVEVSLIARDRHTANDWRTFSCVARSDEPHDKIVEKALKNWQNAVDRLHAEHQKTLDQFQPSPVPRPTTKGIVPPVLTADCREALAIRAALGNNGGRWSEHYTHEQREHWRQFVRDLESVVQSELAKVAPC